MPSLRQPGRAPAEPGDPEPLEPLGERPQLIEPERLGGPGDEVLAHGRDATRVRAAAHASGSSRRNPRSSWPITGRSNAREDRCPWLALEQEPERAVDKVVRVARTGREALEIVVGHGHAMARHRAVASVSVTPHVQPPPSTLAQLDIDRWSSGVDFPGRSDTSMSSAAGPLPGEPTRSACRNGGTAARTAVDVQRTRGAAVTGSRDAFGAVCRRGVRDEEPPGRRRSAGRGSRHRARRPVRTATRARSRGPRSCRRCRCRRAPAGRPARRRSRCRPGPDRAAADGPQRHRSRAPSRSGPRRRERRMEDCRSGLEQLDHRRVEADRDRAGHLEDEAGPSRRAVATARRAGSGATTRSCAGASGAPGRRRTG